MSSEPPGAPRHSAAGQPAGDAGAGEQQAGRSEQELRAAYEAELTRITSAEMVLQAAVSLLNIGGYKLGAPSAEDQPAGAARDLEQVRDAIDGVRGLLPILERRMPSEVRPLRDALSRLQMAYAREAASTASEQPSASTGGETPPAQQQGGERRPGPAETSGRLWVPGR